MGKIKMITVKKIAQFLTAFIMTLSVTAYLPENHTAAQSPVTGSGAVGADFTYIQNVYEVNAETMFGADKTGTSFTQAQLQNALDYARDNASDETMIKVYIPKGTYLLQSRLTVYSNTWIYCEDGVVFKRCTANGPLLCSASIGTGGYDDTHNIVIEGGTWDGNTDYYRNWVGFSNIRFGHCSNIMLKNMNVINNQGGHHVEIGGAKGVTIEGCSFSGYFDNLGNDKEAIQLDTMNSAEVFVGYQPFDDTSCEDIVIRNNTFTDIPRGIGSHSATVGVYYKNIIIENNTFNNMSGIAMIMYNYKNCTIRNNVVNGCTSGMELKNMSGHPDNNFHAPAIGGIFNIIEKIFPFSDTIIENNSITTSYHKEQGYATGIIVSGYKVQNAKNIPDYNYKISGVIIKNNEINTVGAGITMLNAFDCTVSENNIYFHGEGEHFSDKNTVNMSDCSDVTFSGNFINSASRNGIVIQRGGQNTISNNVIQNTNYIGVNVKESSNSNKIISNNIIDSGHHGILINSGSSAEINDNSIERASGAGIIAYGNSSCTAQNNYINGSGQHGIIMENVNHADVISNTVSNSAKDGVLIYRNTSGVKLDSNLIINSGKNGVTVCKNCKNGINLQNNTIKKAKQFGISVNTNANAFVSGNTIENINSYKICVSKDSSVSIPKITGMKATQQSANSVKISYNRVSPTAVYNIYRKSGKNGSYKLIKTTSALSYTDSKLSSNTYYYKVRAYENANNKQIFGGYSSELYFKSGSQITISDAAFYVKEKVTYTGTAIKPSVTVKKNGKVLKNGTDYTVSYSSNTNIGKAKAVVTGKGAYKGSKTLYFEIFLKRQNILNVSAGKNQISFSWNKSGYADGYEYQISLSPDFKNASIMSIKNNSITSKKILGMSSGKTYYVRVRDYKNVSKIKYSGDWSQLKQIICE